MAKEILFMSFAGLISAFAAHPTVSSNEDRLFEVFDVTNIYAALGAEGTFRILVLEKGRPQQPISCVLKHVSSLDRVEYEALSYAWDEQTTTGAELIHCNTVLLWIQPNLASALRTLRHPSEDRVLWVDAICINQANPQEKATQVPVMRDIYANARQVIIWLGEERESDRGAFDFLRWLSLHLDDGYGWARIKLEQSHNLKSVVNLLDREWFRRTWVVQELASAQSAVLIQGRDSIPWDIVSDVLTKLRHPSFLGNYMENRETQAALNSILAMETARRCVNGTFSLSLFQILLATCFNDCSDPRDKIFAVLGLAKDWLEKGGLVPDYSNEATAEEVFKRFAMWDVKKNGQIRILSCATDPDQPSQLPSWAPDWRKIKNGHPFVLYSGRTMFSASANLAVEAWYSDHGRIFHTIGEVVDSVNTVGSEPSFCRLTAMSSYTNKSNEQIGNFVSWLTECHQQAADLGEGLSIGRYEQFWRTMTCGLTGDASPVPSEYEGYFREYWAFMRSSMDFVFPKPADQTTLPSQEDESVPLSPIRNFSGGDPDVMTHALIESSFEKWSSRRRFCTTSHGRLACMPLEAQKGDLICILYGGEVPYLLRPHQTKPPDHYTVVGECYVDGIMHGEAVSSDISRLRHFKLV
ncbi:hypothetical protein MMC17_004003 [Xylographa soralifera]|nr:hypothetical protein [Xylographa soralifera]